MAFSETLIEWLSLNGSSNVDCYHSTASANTCCFYSTHHCSFAVFDLFKSNKYKTKLN